MMQQPYYYPQAGAMPDQLTMYRQPYTAPMQQNPAQCGMIWVQGEAAAKAYAVAPGEKVTLWDSEQPLIYLKSTNQFGMPNPMQILRWENYTPAQPQDQGEDRIRALEEKYNALAARIDAIAAPRPAEQEVRNAERTV